MLRTHLATAKCVDSKHEAGLANAAPAGLTACGAQAREGLMLRTHLATAKCVDSKHEAGLTASSAKASEGLMLRDREAIVSKHEAGLTALSTGHPRVSDMSRRSRQAKAEAHPEDLGSRRGGTLSNPHDPTTESLGMRVAHPRMSWCWSRGETSTASAPS